MSLNPDIEAANHTYPAITYTPHSDNGYQTAINVVYLTAKGKPVYKTKQEKRAIIATLFASAVVFIVTMIFLFV